MTKAVFVFAVLLIVSIQASAVTRAILIPGRTAILLMEGVSASGVDLDPRNLYEAIQQVPVQQPGGKGKIVKTAAGDFNLACVTRDSTRESVVCNITIQPSANSQIAATSVEFHLAMAEAAQIYALLAGANGATPFVFETSTHQMKIESTPERFDFTFHQ